MKLCIYGAGAIGGMLAVHAVEAGGAVTLIARGPHLAALQAKGLTYVSDGRERTVPVRAVATPQEAGPQDYVIVTLKAPGVAAIAEPMQPLLGPDTTVVTAQNGIPWWYFYRHGGPHDGRILESVDPGGRLTRLIPPERCLGCVVYPSAELTAPGRVEHGYGNRFMLGEPDGSRSARAKALSDLLNKGGLKAPVRPKIRDDIWVKLWGNLSFNPVSALTGGTLGEIAADPGTRALIAGMMAEAQQVGEALGVSFGGIDIETRIGWAADLGQHRTSMLQDLELKRPMEIEALVGVVAELGDLTDVPTPLVDAVLALLRQRPRLAGCL